MEDRKLKIPMEYLKVGQFVRWSAERLMSSWDCPCIITNVNIDEGVFSLQSFDDFKITVDISIYTTERISEFTIIDKYAVVTYLKNSISKERIKIQELEMKINTCNSNINRITEKLGELSE